MADTAIHSRTLLVWLAISTWTARRYDKKISQKVNADFHASDNAGRYNKFLLPGDAASYKTLLALAGSIRAAHYNKTLAWSDEGWRLLPSAEFMNFSQWFREQRAAYETALDLFVTDYPAMQAEAKIKLNGMYHDEDYPAAEDIRQRFALSVQYSPVPAVGDIRVDLGADQISEIESSITERIEGATRIAVQDAWYRLHACVAKVSERLSDPDAIFRDSLIENTREICDALQRLNVTDDPDLETMRRRVAEELTTYGPGALRELPAVRQAVAEQAAAILSQMRDVYGVTA